MKFPIRIRLAIASCAVFLLVIAALEVGAYVSVRAAIRSIVDHELVTRLDGLDDHLTRHIVHMPWPQLSESLKLHPAFQPDLLRIQTANGVVLLNGAALSGLDLPQPSSAISIQTVGGVSRMLRVLVVRRAIDGDTYNLALATDLLLPTRILGRLWLFMGLSLPLVLLISGGAGYWISGKALKPVSDMIAAARSIDSSRLSERISVPASGDEIQQLAETMNAMLARIDTGFQQIRQFTANASHELRTPLSIIRASAEVALLDVEDRSGRSARKALARILKEAERDTAILEDMLRLARAESAIAADPAQHKPTDLRTAVTAACSDIRPLADLRSLTVRLTTSRVPCCCDADDEQLRRLWLILLDNAVKYTPAGGTVSAEAGVTPQRRPFVSVSDTGIGIARQDAGRIFEPFYRVDKVRTRSHGGAGLGLAIARHIAHAHGAVITLDSEPGRGSRFCVTFPASRSFPRSLQPGVAGQSSGNAQVPVMPVQ